MRKYIVYRTQAQEKPLTKTSKTLRQYSSGATIPESLPDTYQLAQNCANCAAYNGLSTICSTYNAPVLPNYWCDTWKSI